MQEAERIGDKDSGGIHMGIETEVVAPPAVFLKAKQRGLQYRPYLPSAGDVYGELTLIRLNDEQHETPGRYWLCLCTCGRTAIRHAKSLNYSVRKGSSPQCAECLRELRSGMSYMRQKALHEMFVQQYEDYGTLWTAPQEERLVRETLADLEAEFGALAKDGDLCPDDLVIATGYPYAASDPAGLPERVKKEKQLTGIPLETFMLQLEGVVLQQTHEAAARALRVEEYDRKVAARAQELTRRTEQLLDTETRREALEALHVVQSLSAGE